MARCRSCDRPAIELIPCEDDSFLCAPCVAAALDLAPLPSAPPAVERAPDGPDGTAPREG
ncbi:MAG TPA: hypothetical protein VMT17_03900 [Anaeromyxobacteraceae bacterium]|nr:hypothetical protein [Anaeromyxobacteraceae bacterium]